MTKRKNMTAAQRQQLLEQKVANLEMVTKISQSLLKQIGTSSQELRRDFNELATRQRDLQYRLLAMQEKLDLDGDDLDNRAEELQVADFDEASEKENVEKGYTETDTVDEDCVVVITTTADKSDFSILRSKLDMAEIAFPKFREDLIGKKPGDVIEADLNGVIHQVTLLKVYSKPEQEEDSGEENTQEDGQQMSAETEASSG